MLTVHLPEGYALADARGYILDYVLEERLGLSWRRVAGEPGQVTLSSAADTRTLSIPDSFFPLAEEQWLDPRSLPTLPLHSLSDHDCLPGDALPVLYGAEDRRLEISDDAVFCPVDIFGSVFFMLSRYEELVCTERDHHGRFPAAASVSARAGFLERPLADEYIALLGTLISHLWPGLPLKRHSFRQEVSCDVDLPFAFARGMSATLRGTASDLLVYRSPARAMQRLAMATGLGRRDRLDPFQQGLETILDANAATDEPVRFFFIPIVTDPTFDRAPELAAPAMQRILARLLDRGHAVGAHPGFATYTSDAQMGASIRAFQDALSAVGSSPAPIHSRQHYLRWDAATTPQLLEASGVHVDHSLAYADAPGFRAGTCHRFPMYDLPARKPLQLRAQPLVAMEASLLSREYLGLPPEAAVERIRQLKAACRDHEGCFTLLWHNSSLETASLRDAYVQAIHS